MLLFARPLFFLLAATLILVACTRERPTPEATATTAVEFSPSEEDPEVVQAVNNTAEAPAEGEAEVAVTTTPSPAATPSPTSQEPFQYVVQEGETLGSIAVKFDTDVEILRRLNNLDSDSLAVGQPIYVPYVEGMSIAGMPTPTPGPFLYTIQIGDTLSGLGARFGVDPIAILEANSESLLDPNNLAIGSTILIPGYQPPPETLPATEAGAGEPSVPADDDELVIHVVQAGQGLIEISLLYGISVAEISAANGLSDQDILRIGQELIIPGVSPNDVAVTQGNVHVVEPGESLLSIALLYGVTVEEIQAANNLDDPDAIFIGQELVIPVQ